jgi:hypothetical protein
MGLNFSLPVAFSTSLSYEEFFYLRNPFNAVLLPEIPCLELHKACAVDLENKEKYGKNLCAHEITKQLKCSMVRKGVGGRGRR